MGINKKLKGFIGTWYARVIILLLASLIIFYLINSIGITIISLSVLAIFAFLDKILDYIKNNKREEKVIEEIIKRISPSNEILEAKEKEIEKSKKKEEKLRRLISRLRSSIKEAGVSIDEIVKSYSNPIKAILLFKWRERHRGRKSTILRDRINDMGFKHIQSGVYILPPIKTPYDINSQEELRQWVCENLIDPIDGELEYVFPLVALLDLGKVFSEKKTPEKAWGRTIFNILEIDEIFPAEFIYKYLKSKHISIEDIIQIGDIIFLASTFCDSSLISKLEQYKDEIMDNLKKVIEKKEIKLDDIPNIDVKILTDILKGLIPKEEKIARGIIKEAKFWNKFLKSKD